MKLSLQFRLITLTVAVLAAVWGFQVLLFDHLAMTFNDPKEDMSFGWYVPVFSAYVLWVERKRIFESIGDASWVGMLATLPFLFLGFLGVRGIQVRFEMLAIIGLIVTIPWALFGWKLAKLMIFPAAFMLFCIPLSTYLDVVTVHLRLISTAMAYGVMKGLGVGITRVGTMLFSPDGAFSIDIAAPCSGLRSIFALSALTVGYAYFNQPTWARRIALAAFAVPLAVFGNMMRIFTICLVGTVASSEFATGFYHDYSGYVVFLAAIAMMVVVGELITKIAEAVNQK